MRSVATKAYLRPRAYVRVQGPDAADLLQRLVVERRPRGRVVRGAAPDAEGPRDRAARRLAPRRGRLPAADRARARRGRARAPAADADRRRAARSSSRSTPRRSSSVQRRVTAFRRSTTACPRSRCSTRITDAEPADDELERLRILARTPRWGREIDDGILPAEAGLDERAVSFTKGCFPGQEPVARLHNRGHVNRALRVLEVEGDRGAARPPRSVCEDGRRPRDELGPRPRARLRPRRGARRRRARWSQAAAPGYTDSPRARSSGDRALPCGGRGRKFESCRAHPSVSPGESRASAGPPPSAFTGRRSRSSSSPQSTSRAT